MPPPGPKPFFSLLDQTLSVQIGRKIRRPFWIDTVGNSKLVEIRIQLDDAVMRVFAQRSAAYASNSEIFIFWMLGTSSILLDRRGLVPAQPDQADPAAGRGRRKLWQRARGAKLPSPRRTGSAAGGAGVPGNEGARRALDRAAHRDAGRRQPRPAHHPDPLQARTRTDRRQPRSRRHAQGRRRNGRHAGGLSLLCARRQRRDRAADRHGDRRWKICAATPSATATPRR